MAKRTIPLHLQGFVLTEDHIKKALDKLGPSEVHYVEGEIYVHVHRVGEMIAACVIAERCNPAKKEEV